MAAGLLAGGLALAVSACSFGIPPLMPETADTTGSIAKPELVKASLGKEEARRANGALALALDPQGSGAPVNWDNPDTKTRGTIVPRGQPFVRSDEICRNFRVTIVAGGAKGADREGLACRVTSDNWDVRYLDFPRQPG